MKCQENAVMCYICDTVNCENGFTAIGNKEEDIGETK